MSAPADKRNLENRIATGEVEGRGHAPYLQERQQIGLRDLSRDQHSKCGVQNVIPNYLPSFVVVFGGIARKNFESSSFFLVKSENLWIKSRHMYKEWLFCRRNSR